MIKILNQDNMEFEPKHYEKPSLIFADCIYESLDFSWVDKYWDMLAQGGVLITMTDYHSAAEYKVHTSKLPDANLVNWLIWKNEFGNFKKDRFRQCHDDIIIFSKGSKFRFDGKKVQVPKATAKSKGLNPSGRTTKLATSVITDITLTTVAKERIKMDDGHLVRWQKPKALLHRLMAPFLLKGDLVIDPWMGSGTCGEVCYDNDWHYIGIENDKEIFNLAEKRLKNFLNNDDYIPF